MATAMVLLVMFRPFVLVMDRMFFVLHAVCAVIFVRCVPVVICEVYRAASVEVISAVRSGKMSGPNPMASVKVDEFRGVDIVIRVDVWQIIKSDINRSGRSPDRWSANVDTDRYLRKGSKTDAHREQ